MSIVLTSNQIKTAGIFPISKNSGFFTLTVAASKNGLYSLKIGSTILQAKSTTPLQVGESYKVLVSQDKSGEYKLTILGSSKDNLPSGPKDSLTLTKSFSLANEFQSREVSGALLNFLIDKKIGGEASRLSKTLLAISSRYAKSSAYSQLKNSSYLETLLTLEGAKKGLVFSSATIKEFVATVFPPPSGPPTSSTKLTEIFNGSKNRTLIQWELYPFSYGGEEDGNTLYGSVTMGKEMSNNFSKLCYLNVNMQIDSMPTTIHFNLNDNCYYLCGDFFKSDEVAYKAVRELTHRALNKIGFKNAKLDGWDYFDGFMVLEE